MISELLSNQLLLSCPPNGENASDGEVCVNDGASVKWVVSDVEAIALANGFKMRSLLACEPLDFGVLLEVLLDDLITLDILMELLVAKLVG